MLLLSISVAWAGDVYGGAAFRLPGPASDIGFAKDGLAALTTTDRIVPIALPDGRVGAARPACEYPSHFEPDGDRAAMTCGYEQLVMLSWPALTPIARLPYQDGELVWAADGSSLALVRGEGITFYDRALKPVGAWTGSASELVGRGGDWYATGPIGDDGDGVLALRADGATRWRLPGRAESLALSIDGQRLLVGRDDAVALVDAKSGEVLRAIPREDTAYEAVATAAGWWVSVRDGFERIDDDGKGLGHVRGSGPPRASGDGRYVLTDTYGPVPRAWRADGTPLHHETLRGDLIAVAGRRGALTALTSSGEVLDVTGAGGEVRAIVEDARDMGVGPGGAVVVVAATELVAVDPGGGARALPRLAEEEYPLAVRADGDKWLVITDRGFRALDGDTLGALRPRGFAELERVVVGEGRVVTGGEYGFDVWDLASGRPLYEGGGGEVWGIGVRPDGAVVAGVTREGYDGDTTRVVVAPGPQAEPWELCCSRDIAPDGRYVVDANERQVRALDPARRTVLASWTLAAPVSSLWIPAPDTVVVELLDGRVEVLDASGIPAPKLAAARAPNLPIAARPAEGDRVDGSAPDLRWTAAGRLLRVGGYALDEIDPRTGVVRQRREVYGWVRAAPIGEDVVVLSRESYGQLVRVRPDGEIAWEQRTEPDSSLFVGGARIVVGGYRGFEVRDAATGARTWASERDREVHALSVDGTTLAVEQDAALALLSAADGSMVRELPVSEPCAAAFSPDGARIAVADDAGRTWIVPVSEGTPIQLDGIGRCPALAWSPDGASLATRLRAELLVWDGRSGRSTAAYTLGQGRTITWGPAGIATEDDQATLILRP